MIYTIGDIVYVPHTAEHWSPSFRGRKFKITNVVNDDYHVEPYRWLHFINIRVAPNSLPQMVLCERHNQLTAVKHIKKHRIE